MSAIDVNVILNTVLGGTITISGSLAVAGLYISNQNKNQRKKQFRQLIEDTYFEKGIFPIFSALTEYGTSSVFAIDDIRKELSRYEEHKNLLLLKKT
jgi:hypothetical protein